MTHLRFDTTLPVASPILGSGRLRETSGDFRVEESLGFELTGSGEHCCVFVEKTNRNTRDVARLLARCAGISARHVSWCGLKDKRAVTRQWFSLWLPGKPDPDFSPLEADDLRILEITRHQRKLNPGSHQGNRFTLRVTDLQWAGENGLNQLQQRLARIANDGVPNYFGEQRFGREQATLVDAVHHLVEGSGSEEAARAGDRFLRGLWISALRGWVFNQVLAERVRQGNWNQLLLGDWAILENRHSGFVVDSPDQEQERAASLAIHPTGPLIGGGEDSRRLPSEIAMAIEQGVLSSFESWQQALAGLRVKGDRRALRLVVSRPEVMIEATADGQASGNLFPKTVQLSFSLPRGGYATTVMDALFRLEGAERLDST